MTKNKWNAAAQRELAWDMAISEGANGDPVLRVQEWLSLGGGTQLGSIDGRFGKLTREAVKRFQSISGLPSTGEVDSVTFARLSAPMKRAFSPFTPERGTSLGSAVAFAARQHMLVTPREVGGPNCGPWVRAYMGGHQGTSYPWCAGFVSTLLLQASEALGTPLPFQTSVGCDEIARAARAAARLVAGSEIAVDPSRLGHGAVFLVRGKSEGDWTHTGIAIAGNVGGFDSIEGNTNQDGAREGTEVRMRRRRWANVDFALLDP